MVAQWLDLKKICCSRPIGSSCGDQLATQMWSVQHPNTLMKVSCTGHPVGGKLSPNGCVPTQTDCGQISEDLQIIAI